MSGKQCRPDQTQHFAASDSGSTLFAQACRILWVHTVDTGSFLHLKHQTVKMHGCRRLIQAFLACILHLRIIGRDTQCRQSGFLTILLRMYTKFLSCTEKRV